MVLNKVIQKSTLTQIFPVFFFSYKSPTQKAKVFSKPQDVDCNFSSETCFEKCPHNDLGREPHIMKRYGIRWSID